jgi:hypothetical protein
MRPILALILLPLLSMAAIDYGGHPSACQSRPCVYTISCAGAGTISEIQTAVDDAHRGDTIKLQAGCTWSTASGSAVWLRRNPPGSAGRVVITSTEEAKLPTPGTRITPVYWPLVPKLELTGGNGPFFAVASGFEGASGGIPGTAGKHWELRGLGFWIDIANPLSTVDITNGFVRIGDSGNVWSKAAGHWTSLTVSNNVAQLTTSVNHTRSVGDLIRVDHPNPAFSGVKTVTAVPTPTTLRFAATVADGTYTDSTMYFAYPADSSQLPDDIVIDRCIFQQGGLSKVRRDILLNGAKTEIRDSFLSMARSSGADSQLITVLAGSGPIAIENNYMAGAVSENFMSGGDRNTLGSPVSGVSLRYNYLAHPPYEARTRTWALLKADGDPVLRGRVVRPTVNNGFFYVALNTGTIGATEPQWCTSGNGCTTTDGTVTWSRFYSSSVCVWCIKNNFEIKSAKDVTISHNVFEYMWNAGQNRAINIKSEQQSLYGNPTFANNCVPTLRGTVNTNGKLVTADTGIFPWMANMWNGYGTNAMGIKIAGVDYTIASFDSATQLTLNSDAGVQTAAPFLYGTDPSVRFCQAALTQNIMMTHNIVRNTLSPFVINPGTNAHRGLTGNFIMRHNLFERTDPTVWTNETGGAYIGSTATSSIFFTPVVSGFVMDHNTILASNTAWAVYGETFAVTYPRDTVITNNIFGKHTNGFYRSSEHPDLASQMCPGSTCPASQWSHNILAGANVSSYTASPGAVANLCPGSGACASPNYGLLFRDFAARKLDVKPGTAFSRKASDGSDYGADMSQLPEIRELSVTATDHLALFRYRVTQPISHIACVVEVSATPDFATYAGELGNIGSYPRQDSDSSDRFPRDGLQRTIVIGHSVPLSAATLYYYRLHCGGDLRTGSFTTLPAVSGLEARSFTFRADSTGPRTIFYGYRYSQATGEIVAGQTATANCTVGESCSVTYSVNRGSVLYWRAGSQPVQVETIR